MTCKEVANTESVTPDTISYMSQSFLVRHVVSVLVAVGLILFVVASFMWWNLVWQSPAAVFSGMLQSNLSTTGVTKYETQTGSGQTLDQTARLWLGSSNISDWVVNLKQSSTSGITTESIGTPTAGYVRYTNIVTTQKQANGTPFDFSNVEKLWAKAQPSDNSTLSSLFSQSLIDVGTAPIPPIANLPQSEQAQLMSYIKTQQIFTTNYQTMHRTRLHGRRVYVYTTQVKLYPYVVMMQQFAKDLGLTTLASADPTQFASSAPVTLQLTVDSASHELTRVVFPAASFEEDYSDYGLGNPVSVPKTTISLTALQSRLKGIEQ
jgi:hypothetical protein